MCTCTFTFSVTQCCVKCVWFGNYLYCRCVFASINQFVILSNWQFYWLSTGYAGGCRGRAAAAHSPGCAQGLRWGGSRHPGCPWQRRGASHRHFCQLLWDLALETLCKQLWRGGVIVNILEGVRLFSGLSCGSAVQCITLYIVITFNINSFCIMWNLSVTLWITWIHLSSCFH